MRRFALLLVVLLAVSAIPAHAQTDLPDTDGIPANCETVDSSYADPNLFPRYANGQLALIDWSSGDTVRVLETGSAAPNFWLLGWSPDCHYVAGGLGDGLRYTTILWDATSGAQMGTVADGYRRPHFLTWSPRGDSLVVETRRGAFLWDLATGTRLQLTLDSFNGESFRQMVWNDTAGTLETVNMVDRIIVFDLTTGRPVNYPYADGIYPGGVRRNIAAPTGGSPYVCSGARIPNVEIWRSEDQLVLLDNFTHEVLQVLEPDFALGARVLGSYGRLSANCDLIFALLFTDEDRNLPREGVVIRLRDSVRVHTISNMPARWSPDFPQVVVMQREEWDAAGRYLFAQSYDGAQVWDSATDSTFYVTSSNESQRYGYSVNTVTWDVANGRITVDMLYSAEIRVFDLATGQRVE